MYEYGLSEIGALFELVILRVRDKISLVLCVLMQTQHYTNTLLCTCQAVVEEAFRSFR